MITATKDPAAGADETFVPVFEALNWMASIDLWFDEQGSPIGDDTLRGIRFARNRVHHDWALAITRQDWPGVPMVSWGRYGGVTRLIGPPPGFYWTWKPLTDLPPPQRPDPKGEAAYVSRLAGSHVEPTLDGLRPILEALR
jgi:hypothetical protein